MKRRAAAWIVSWTGGAAAALLAGCAGTGTGVVNESARLVVPGEPDEEPTINGSDETADELADELARTIAAYDEARLLKPTPTPSELRLAEQIESARQTPEREPEPPTAAALAESQPVAEPIPEPVVEPEPPAPPPPPTTAELLATVAGRLHAESLNGGDPLRAATLLALASPLDPEAVGATLDELIAAELSPIEAEQIERLRRLAGDLPPAALDERPDVLLAAADELSTGRPIRIPSAVLCAEVSGYGAYEPFDRNSFLVGSAPRIGVYVEVERANRERRSGPDGTERHVVRLSKEILIYHDPDGLLAWKRPAEAATLSSRTPLRDVSLATPVDLPSTLTVGRYRMKVVVRDLIGDSIAEAVVPFEMVADASLAGVRTGGRR